MNKLYPREMLNYYETFSILYEIMGVNDVLKVSFHKTMNHSLLENCFKKYANVNSGKIEPPKINILSIEGMFDILKAWDYFIVKDTYVKEAFEEN